MKCGLRLACFIFLGLLVTVTVGCPPAGDDGDATLVSPDDLHAGDQSDPQPDGYACPQTNPCGLGQYALGLPDTGVLFVNSCCLFDGSADGTLERPYSTIADALVASDPGATLALATGTHAGGVTVEMAVIILGPSSDRCMIRSQGAQTTLAVGEATGGKLTGFALMGDASVGLRMDGAEDWSLNDLLITDYANGEDGQPRYGAIIQSSKNITVTGLRATNNGAYAMVFSASTGSISGCQFQGNGDGCLTAVVAAVNDSSLRFGGDELGKDPADAGALEKGGCLFADNLGIGIWAQNSAVDVRGVSFADNACGAALFDSCSGSAVLESGFMGNTIASSVGFGLALYDSELVVENNSIVGIVAQKDGYRGDCVFVTGEGAMKPSVDLLDNELRDCEGVGILVNGAVKATVERNTLTSPFQGGIWIQGGADAATVSENLVQQAGAVGISVLGSTLGTLSGNQIIETGDAEFYDFKNAETITMADGILLTGMAVDTMINVTNNIVNSSNRAGMIIDNCKTGSIVFGEGNVVAGNRKGGVVLQNGSEGLADKIPGVVSFTFESLGANGGGGDVVVDEVFSFLETQAVAGLTQACIPPDCGD